MQMTRFTRVGFILATAGSAVGLGNVWKFPYMTGTNGGGAFVLIYLLSILAIGITLFLSEAVIGRLTRKAPVQAFEALAPEGKKGWKYAGFIIITPVLIASFYLIVMGWLFKYLLLSISSLPSSTKEAEGLFGSLVSADFSGQFIYFCIAFFITFLIVSKGLKAIEKANIILMPLLFLILVGLMIYGMFLDGFKEAIKFLFVPDFSKFSSSSILAAVGQAFFTLSVGVGVVITYATALPEKVNLFRSSVLVAILDTVIALVAGIMIFSFTFHYGLQPGEGPGLIFVTLPSLFGDLGVLGNIISILFFIALAFAGITSSISMVEPTISYLENSLHFTRKKAILCVGSVVFFLGFLALISNINDLKSYVTYFGKSFFDILDMATSMIMMPIGGILLSIFVGFVINKQKLYDLLVPHMGEKLFNIWLFTLRFIVPICVIIVALNSIIG